MNDYARPVGRCALFDDRTLCVCVCVRTIQHLFDVVTYNIPIYIYRVYTYIINIIVYIFRPAASDYNCDIMSYSGVCVFNINIILFAQATPSVRQFSLSAFV